MAALLHKAVINAVFATVLIFIGYSIWIGEHQLGWWWLPYWFATTVLCAVVVGIPNGLITGWMSLDDRRVVPLNRRLVVAASIAWLATVVVITWYLADIIARWFA